MRQPGSPLSEPLGNGRWLDSSPPPPRPLPSYRASVPYFWAWRLGCCAPLLAFRFCRSCAAIQGARARRLTTDTDRLRPPPRCRRPEPRLARTSRLGSSESRFTHTPVLYITACHGYIEQVPSLICWRKEYAQRARRPCARSFACPPAVTAPACRCNSACRSLRSTEAVYLSKHVASYLPPWPCAAPGRCAGRSFLRNGQCEVPHGTATHAAPQVRTR